MKPLYKTLLFGWLTIALFDVLGCIASRHFNFNYTYLASGSFIIYCAFGFLGTKKIDLKTGVGLAAAVGLFDSTIGWEISMLLKVNTGNIENNPSITIWVITAVFVTGLAALCGLIGGGLAKAFKSKESAKYNS